MTPPSPEMVERAFKEAMAVLKPWAGQLWPMTPLYEAVALALTAAHAQGRASEAERYWLHHDYPGPCDQHQPDGRCRNWDHWSRFEPLDEAMLEILRAGAAEEARRG